MKGHNFFFYPFQECCLLTKMPKSSESYAHNVKAAHVTSVASVYSTCLLRQSWRQKPWEHADAICYEKSAALASFLSFESNKNDYEHYISDTQFDVMLPCRKQHFTGRGSNLDEVDLLCPLRLLRACDRTLYAALSVLFLFR